MVEIIVIVVLIVINYFAFSFFFYKRRFPPLYNIVLGKATYETLPDETKRQVQTHALEIINRTWGGGGFSDANFNDEPHRFSWYALAMAELGIPPIRNNLGTKWHFVKKPHLYPIKGGSIYEGIVERLKKESGVIVSITFPLPRPPSRRADAREGQTALDAFNAAAEPLLVSSYRSIGAKIGRAPTSKTSDADIVGIYRKVGTAFRAVSNERGEHLPAGYLNAIVFKFYQVREQFGDKFMDEHLAYELNKYRAEGLREDYKVDMKLF